MKKILLTGANGMLGTDFVKHFGNTFEILPFDREDGDITNIETINQLIKSNTPDVILNFAAYTNVEDAEDVGKKINFDVNSLGVYNLAKLSKKYNIDLITISTDYVFDGTKSEGYNENDTLNPINSYGMAKYLGEKLARQENSDTIIVRTSWLYGGGNEFNNFINTMLKLSETRKELKIVDDQFGSPTYTMDLCEALVKITENINDYKGKTFHLCNQTGVTGISWFEFAQQIFKVAKREIVLLPCSSTEFPTKATRPKSSKLINNSSIQLSDRKDGLQEYLETPL